MNLIGMDLGTSGVKVIVVNPDGKVLGGATEDYPVASPRPMWSEQDPEDWWAAVGKAVRRALTEAGVDGNDVGGIGLSGQMVGLVALDSSGTPLRPCILWNDQRSAEVTEALTERIGLDAILAETSNPLFASFIAPKVVWLRENEPDVYRRIATILMPKDYINYRLTGEKKTEVSDASGTCVFNVAERRWSETMLEHLDIPPAWMPECLESNEITGRLGDEAAQATGLRAGTPVVAGAGDQPAQALGCGIVRSGLCSVTIGTSGVVFAQTDSHLAHPEGLLHSFCHCLPGQWYLMGVMLSAGGAFQWLRELLGSAGAMTFERMTEEAAKAPPGSEGLVFLPYLSGERCPHDDPRARGGFIGLTQRHGLPALCRSVMEGISFGLLDSIQIMRDLGMDIRHVMASGGAVSSPLWRQMLADIFQVEVSASARTEGGALGAAMLAGLGTGAFESAEEASAQLVHTDHRVEPASETAPRYREVYEVYRELYGTLRTSFHALTALNAGGNRPS